MTRDRDKKSHYNLNYDLRQPLFYQIAKIERCVEYASIATCEYGMFLSAFFHHCVGLLSTASPKKNVRIANIKYVIRDKYQPTVLANSNHSRARRRNTEFEFK